MYDLFTVITELRPPPATRRLEATLEKTDRASGEGRKNRKIGTGGDVETGEGTRGEEEELGGLYHSLGVCVCVRGRGGGRWRGMELRGERE